MTIVDSPIVSPLLLPAKVWAPPGRGLLLATVVVLLVALEASSRVSFEFFFLAFTAGMVIGAVWLWRIVPTVVHRRLGLRASEWARWIAVPVILVATAVSSVSGVPFDLRLAASRGAMDEAAHTLIADEDLTYSWIGWFPVGRIDRIDGGVRFLIAGSGFLDPIGFAYSTDGEPPRIGEDGYEHLDGNWWHWRESW